MTAVGPGVTHVTPGDRVAYTAPAPLGSYADERVVDARWLVKLPAAIGDADRRGDDAEGPHGLVPVEAQLPGRGRRLDPAVRRRRRRRAHRGAVGARARRARHRRRRHAGEARARARRTAASTCCSTATTSRGACASSRAAACPSFTIRSAARRSISRSIACGRTALLVSFGNSSGKVEPFGLHELTKRGSLYVTRPTLYDFIRDRAALEAGAAELFALVETRRSRDRGQPDLRAARCGASAPRSRGAANDGLHGPDSLAAQFLHGSARFARRCGAARCVSVDASAQVREDGRAEATPRDAARVRVDGRVRGARRRRRARAAGAVRRSCSARRCRSPAAATSSSAARCCGAARCSHACVRYRSRCRRRCSIRRAA